MYPGMHLEQYLIAVQTATDLPPRITGSRRVYYMKRPAGSRAQEGSMHSGWVVPRVGSLLVLRLFGGRIQGLQKLF